jgi:undecaprenyl diphosphate synthase
MPPLPADLQENLQKLHIRGNIPRHVAIIMDGNGRWSHKQSVDLAEGHRTGSERAREIVEFCSHIEGLNILTLYAFSTENWRRPEMEIKTLFKLLVRFLKQELPTMQKNNIRLNILGEPGEFPAFVRRQLNKVVSKTASNNKFILNLALNYGGRDEIVRAIEKVGSKLENGELKLADFTEELFSGYLDTAGQPSPDLLIRTSGEQRLSNFMLWQVAYSELYFTDVLWPDFDRSCFLSALLDYQGRERRFGRRESKTEE